MEVIIELLPFIWSAEVNWVEKTTPHLHPSPSQLSFLLEFINESETLIIISTWVAPAKGQCGN